MLVPLGQFSLVPGAERLDPHGTLACRYDIIHGVKRMTPIVGTI